MFDSQASPPPVLAVFPWARTLIIDLQLHHLGLVLHLWFEASQGQYPCRRHVSELCNLRSYPSLTMLLAHKKLHILPHILPRPLSITEGRSLGLTFSLSGGIGTTWSFVLTRILDQSWSSSRPSVIDLGLGFLPL